MQQVARMYELSLLFIIPAALAIFKMREGGRLVVQSRIESLPADQPLALPNWTNSSPVY